MNINTRKAHNSLDVNALFDKFFDTFSCTLDKLAPLKKASRKQKKTTAEALDCQSNIELN